LICRGGSITSHPYKCPQYKGSAPSSFLLGPVIVARERKEGGLGHLSKIALSREEVLISFSLVEML
jgi:hypothetical protein